MAGRGPRRGSRAGSQLRGELAPNHVALKVERLSCRSQRCKLRGLVEMTQVANREAMRRPAPSSRTQRGRTTPLLAVRLVCGCRLASARVVVIVLGLTRLKVLAGRHVLEALVQLSKLVATIQSRRIRGFGLCRSSTAIFRVGVRAPLTVVPESLPSASQSQERGASSHDGGHSGCVRGERRGRGAGAIRYQRRMPSWR